MSNISNLRGKICFSSKFVPPIQPTLRMAFMEWGVCRSFSPHRGQGAEADGDWGLPPSFGGTPLVVQFLCLSPPTRIVFATGNQTFNTQFYKEYLAFKP